MLEEQGFTKQDGAKAYQLEDATFTQIKDDKGIYPYLINVIYDDDDIELCVLHYLHQLQNFYAKELERELTVHLPSSGS